MSNISLDEAKRRLVALGFKCGWREKRTVLVVSFGDNELRSFKYVADGHAVSKLRQWRNERLNSSTKHVR